MVETFDCSNTSLKYGSKGTKVSLLQKYLKELGYYTYSNGYYLKIDGDFKTYTQTAVKKFQKATGLKDDGWFGELSCKKLNEIILKKNNATVEFTCKNIDLKKGSKDTTAVKKVQQALTNLGYYTRQVDGDYGDFTVTAVKNFQKDKNLQQTGSIDPQTCNLLTSTNTTKVNEKATQTTVKPAVDPNKVDASKTVYSSSNSNIGIDGLYFIASSIEPKTPFNNSEWKNVELLNGKYKFYKGHPAPMEWTVELYLHKIQINKLRQEFIKMQNRVCNVVSDDLISGKYVISVNYSTSKGFYRKVTLTLTQYLV